MPTPSWRTHAAALAVLFAFVVALFPFAFFRNEALIGDSDRLMHELPTYRALSDALVLGEAPGWNPGIYCGTRLLGDPMLPAANPVMLGLCRFFPDSLATATTWLLIVQALFALVCGYFFFQAYVPHPWGAIPPALALAVSTAALENMNRGAAYGAYAFAPAVFWLLRDLSPSSPMRNAFLLAPVLHLQITGSELQRTSYMILLYFCFVAAESYRSTPFPWRDFLRRFSSLALALALAGGAAAFQFLPLLDGMGRSDRTSWSLSDAWKYSSHHPFAALRLFFPHIFGNGATFPPGGLGPNTNEFEMFVAYPGLVCLALGGLALARLRDRRVWPWAALSALLILASLRTPFLAVPYFLYGGKPLYHGRLSHMVPVAAAFLIPAGLAWFLGTGRRAQARVSAALAALGAASLLAAWDPLLEAWTSRLPERLLACFGRVRDVHDAYCHGVPAGTRMPAFPDLAGPALVLFGAGTLAVGGAGLLLAAGKASGPGFVRAAALVALADFLWVGRATLQPFPCPEGAVGAPNALSSFLTRLPDRGLHRVSFDGFVPWPGTEVTAGLFRYNLHQHHGLLSEGGYANFLDRRANAFHSLDRPLFRWKPRATDEPYWADLYAVKYVVTRDGPDTRAFYGRFYDPVHSSDGALVFRKREALPRFRLLARWDASLSAEEILEGFRRRELPLDVAYLEDPSRAPPLPPEAAYPGRLTILRETPNRIEGEADLPAPRLLLSANTWDAGWRAEVNGRPAEILRADYAYQAILLPAGASRFTLAYTHPKSALGLSVTAAALAVWAAVGLLGRRSLSAPPVRPYSPSP